MSVIQVKKNRAEATMTIVVALDATVEQVWDLWADPRKLEKWWGPPTWPATFDDFTLAVGQEANYFMTGPEGEKAGGWWKFTDVQAPSKLEITDGFANPDGSPSDDSPPMSMTVTLVKHGDATHLELTTKFKDEAHFDELLEMGMEEGMAGALGQMDMLLK